MDKEIDFRDDEDDEAFEFSDIDEDAVDGDGKPISKYQQQGRNGEYMRLADRVSAAAVYRIKKAMYRKAEQGDVAAAKLLFQMFREQQQARNVGKTVKEISLGFGVK